MMVVTGLALRWTVWQRTAGTRQVQGCHLWRRQDARCHPTPLLPDRTGGQVVVSTPVNRANLQQECLLPTKGSRPWVHTTLVKTLQEHSRHQTATLARFVTPVCCGFHSHSRPRSHSSPAALHWPCELRLVTRILAQCRQQPFASSVCALPRRPSRVQLPKTVGSDACPAAVWGQRPASAARGCLVAGSAGLLPDLAGQPVPDAPAGGGPSKCAVSSTRCCVGLLRHHQRRGRACAASRADGEPPARHHAGPCTLIPGVMAAPHGQQQQCWC